VGRELCGGEAQPASPALAALVEHGHAGVRQCDPSCVEQLARLADREPQIDSPQLGQTTREAQPVESQRHRRAREEHDAEPRGQLGEEALKLSQGLGRLELM
jgi:hypothetical protein